MFGGTALWLWSKGWISQFHFFSNTVICFCFVTWLCRQILWTNQRSRISSEDFYQSVTGIHWHWEALFLKKKYRDDCLQDILWLIIGHGSSPGHPVKPHALWQLQKEQQAKGDVCGGLQPASQIYSVFVLDGETNAREGHRLGILGNRSASQLGRNPQAQQLETIPLMYLYQVIGMVNLRRAAGKLWDTVVSRVMSGAPTGWKSSHSHPCLLQKP